MKDPKKFEEKSRKKIKSKSEKLGIVIPRKTRVRKKKSLKDEKKTKKLKGGENREYKLYFY